MERSSLTGSLLVAGPGLIDPNFARTVVLVCHHHPDGALGLVLNRPTDLQVGEVLPGWVERLCDPPVVFLGGPVQNEVAVGLGRLLKASAPPGSFEDLGGGVGLLDLGGSPAEASGRFGALRVYSGYAGWGAGQLDEEVSTGDWLVTPADAGDPFTTDPLGLRRVVLRRAGGSLAWYADYPIDSSLN
jgi:putative transcriptional regulator